jgi:hypothetical protein
LQYFRGLLHRQAGEKSKLDHPALLPVELGQPVQRVVQSHQLDAPLVGNVQLLIERERHHAAAPLFAMPGAGVIDQNPPDEFARDGEELRAILPLDPRLIDQL